MAPGMRTDFRPNLDIWGVPRQDCGWLYMIRVGPRFKVGRTKSPARRILTAKTWLPEFELVGMKPFWNIRHLERQLLAALAQFWVAGEWYQFPDETYDQVFEDFIAFYDEDPDMNSVDFLYWMHDFGEVLMEFYGRNISLKKWQRDAGAGSATI